MSRQFRTGEFNRGHVHRRLRLFCPLLASERIQDISLEALKKAGKRVILLDVDNTLTKWGSEVIDEPVIGWIRKSEEMGFSLAVLSNTRHPARLNRLAALMKVPVITGRFKPSRSMYRQALVQFQATPDEAVMIGDQILTDILGANRAGIDAILLKPLAKKEFALTKINRWIEARIVVSIYNSLVTPIDALRSPQPIVKNQPVSKISHQFLKFIFVGGISFVIATGLSVLFIDVIKISGETLGFVLGSWLQHSLPLLFSPSKTPDQVARPFLFAIANFIAMFNSFIWNRSWTFNVGGKQDRIAHLIKFYLVSIIGWIFTFVIASFTINLLKNDSSKSVIIAQIVAAIIVAFWNFGGQRFYAFKPSEK